jgi:predicted phosphoribosyltransferase
MKATKRATTRLEDYYDDFAELSDEEIANCLPERQEAMDKVAVRRMTA